MTLPLTKKVSSFSTADGTIMICMPAEVCINEGNAVLKIIDVLNEAINCAAENDEAHRILQVPLDELVKYMKLNADNWISIGRIAQSKEIVRPTQLDLSIFG